MRFPLLVWPVISFGYYQSFVDYPGSWSISEKTFIQCVLDIIESIAKHNDNQLILLNTGIRTIRPHRTTLINVYSGKHFTAVVEDIEEQIQGGHADEIETSIMLAIDKSLVDMKSAKPGLKDIKKGPLNLFDPKEHNYCPTGAMGNPTLASVEKGEKFLNAILADLNDRISSIINVK